MIRSLRIRNLATIEDLEICFQEGFSILTGETGAGKSIIIDGIKLVLGDKSSAELVRTGKQEASIEAIFRLPSGQPLPQELPSGEPDEVFIQRQIPLDGPGKAYLNGVLIPIKKLKEVSPVLVDIYGQNDHVFLLQLENHLYYLDQFLGLAALRDEVAGKAQELRRLSRQKSELETRKREREQRLDFLGFQVREIENAKLKPGEWEELQTERNILKNAEKIAGLIERALDLAYLGEESVSAHLARLQEAIGELGRYDPACQSFSESLQQSAIAVRELADFLIKFKDKQDLGPERLEEIEARLTLIEKLKRKYGETAEDILRHHDKVKHEHDELLQSEERLAELEGEISCVFQDYKACTEKLSRLRRQGARTLESQVEEEIALLGMKRAKFRVRIAIQPLSGTAPDKIRDSGLDDVEFLISPNPGEELRPLRKIASGGELSRIMLALKTIGRDKSGLKTLIFDEIDSGIGGKTAESIAVKLRQLARQHQVICITHLPQIASFSPHHYRIDKKIEGSRTYTTVKELGFEERVEEVSRLLSGSRITPTSLQNAREMLLHNMREEKKGRKKNEPSRPRRQ